MGGITRWPPERVEQAKALLAETGTLAAAAARLGVSRTVLKSMFHDKGIEARDRLPDLPPLPAADPDSLGALRARLVELEDQIAAQAPVVEEGEVAPAKDSHLVLCFDAHKPLHDPRAFGSFLRFLRAQRPDELIISELWEWLSLSQHGNSSWGTLWEQEKAAAKRDLVQIRSIVGNDCRITIQEANHDTRLTRLLENVLPSFQGSITIPRELGLADLGIEWVGERTVLRRGKLKIIHGHQLESGMRGCLPKYHAARAIEKYGEVGSTVVYGHTHKEQTICMPFEGGHKRAVNIGCLRTLVPEWHKSREEGWSHSFGDAYVSAGGATNLYTVQITNGAFTYAGKRYSAAA